MRITSLPGNAGQGNGRDLKRERRPPVLNVEFSVRRRPANGWVGSQWERGIEWRLTLSHGVTSEWGARAQCREERRPRHPSGDLAVRGRGRKEWEGGNDVSNSLSPSSRVPATSEFFADSTTVP